MQLKKLPLRYKIALIIAPVLLAAIAAATALTSQTWDMAKTAEQEYDGLLPIDKIGQVIRLTQQHRGLSSAWLSGNESAAADRIQRQNDVDKAMADVPETMKKAGFDGATVESWKPLMSRWADASKTVSARSADVGSVMKAHTALIQDELAVIDQGLYDSGLILDPSADTYSLVTVYGQSLPAEIKLMGQLRARGSALLAKKTPDTQDLIQVTVLMGQIAGLQRQLETAIKHSKSANAAIGPLIDEPTNLAMKSTSHLLDLAQKELVNSSGRSLDSSAFFKAATADIDAQYHYLNVVSTVLSDTLRERSDSTRMRAIVAAIVVLVLSVLSVWMAWVVVSKIVGNIDQAARIASKLAQGQLNSDIPNLDGDETAKLLKAMHDMQRDWKKIVLQVRQGAESVASASVQIAQGNQDLSSRTESQASSLEQTAASMEQLSATVKQNADNAKQANQLALAASQVASEGGQTMTEVVSTMGQINDSSHKIVDIVGVIDGIAFQTNILALNAAVEAARAGELGRGFAVVSSEVRNLAKRSGEAAREIKQLIASNLACVESGSGLVNAAGTRMNDLVTSVQRVADIVGEISSASHEQSLGVAQVGEAVGHMDRDTQQNAALVEEMAASASGLRTQATDLVGVVNLFKMA